MFWFIVFLLMLGAVFYMYQNLKTMEKEIREEQQREKDISDQQERLKPEPASAPKVAVTPEPVAEVSEVEVEPSSAPQAEAVTTESDNEIIALIKANPGIKQTELYAKVETMSTKQAQQMLKKLADSGEIKREKVGSSYKLYV